MSKPQRRKGNAKAASSAHAASLLASSGRSVPFIGFDGGFTNVFESVEAEVSNEIDHDVIIVFKKLSKKDPQTREKALRELLDILVEKEPAMVELCFSHYATIYDRLSLDGSPTVRVLSTKVAAFLIAKLQKAAEKQLPKIIPFVLLATCDMSNAVCSQADALLNDCFPNGKSSKVISVFSASTATLATEIVAQKHPLIQPQKYDEEEKPDQRETRITVQSLQILSKLATTQKDCAKLESILSKLFEDTATMKKLLKGSPLVQSAVLGVALLLTNAVQTLVDSPLSQFLVNSLDSPEASISRAAFHGFMQLASEDRFFAKIDLKKAVVPKLLNVVRKKQGHWRHCSSFLLPSMALVLDRLASEDEQRTFVAAFLDSFLDNLPFETSQLMPLWATAFSECVKCALTKVPGKETADKCSGLLLSAFDVVVSDSEESVLFCLADVVFWVCAKSVMTPTQLANFVDLLQLNLMNKRPSSNRVLSLLLSPCTWELRHLHVGILRVPSIVTSFVAPLRECSEEYLDYVNKELSLVRLLTGHRPSFDRDEANRVAEVVVRCLAAGYGDREQIVPAECVLRRSILAAAAAHPSEVAWQVVRSVHDNEDSFLVDCAESMLAWMKANDNKSALRLLARLKIGERSESVRLMLKECSSQNVPFLIACLSGVEWDEETRTRLSTLIFYAFFDVWTERADESSWLDSIIECLARFPPEEKCVRRIIPAILGGTGSQMFSRGEHAMSHSDAEQLSLRIARLLKESQLYEGLLIAQDTMETIVTGYNKKLMSVELPCCSALFTEIKDEPYEFRVDELQSMVNINILLTAIYAPIDVEELSPEVASRHLACLAVQCAIGSLVPQVDLFLATRCEDYATDLRKMTESAREVMGKDNSVELAFRGLLACDVRSATVQYTLRWLRDEFPAANIGEIVSSLDDRLMATVNCALRLEGGRTNRTETAVQRWITRFHCDEYRAPFDFLLHLQEYMQTNAQEWEAAMFNAASCDDTESEMWKLNVVCLYAASDVLNRFPTALTPEGRDFIMCGLVTALDSSDERCVNGLPSSLAESSFLSMSLRLFTTCHQLAGRVGARDEFGKEWTEFFFPTLSRIVVRLWTFVEPTHTPTPLVRALCKAVAVVREISSDLALRDTFTPELDLLNYEPGLQTLILSTVNCVKSPEPSIQLAALKMLRLLAPLVYRHENGVWSEDEEKVSSSGPRKLLIPFVLHRLMMESRGLPAFMAIDAALQPLMCSVTCDEERVAYCDAFPPVVGQVLPQLITACPEPEQLTRSQREDFFLVENLSYETIEEASLVLERYKCHLLYRILGRIPATVRTWYNSLPSNAAAIVNKYVKKCCSRSLINDELATVKRTNKEQLANEKLLKIRVVPTTGEVVAEYVVEETTMRLAIEMAADYPLSVPGITLDKAVVASERAKKWLLQLTAYLFHQNGPTVDGILMWRRNVDRDVEGAEACCICMMTIHSNSHQLPKVKCRQCKNKFHSNCLYKWFESSNQSSCPLCRSNFT